MTLDLLYDCRGLGDSF